MRNTLISLAFLPLVAGLIDAPPARAEMKLSCPTGWVASAVSTNRYTCSRGFLAPQASEQNRLLREARALAERRCDNHVEGVAITLIRGNKYKITITCGFLT